MTKVIPRYFLLLSFSFLSLFITGLHAEGTKTWSPNSTDKSALRANPAGTYSFAGYDGPADKRLHIHIEDAANEIVYIGLGQQIDSLSGDPIDTTYDFRIKSPAGAVVHGPFSTNPVNLTSYNVAVTGPGVITPGGYSVADAKWVFDPAVTGSGDYYIEFSDVRIQWFDITVATKGANPTAINGRVWSKAWAVRTNDGMTSIATAFDVPFNGTLVAYDGKYATKIDFNGAGIRPLEGQFTFNSTGTGNTGNKINDRKSVNGAPAGNPGHKIFLNQPDPTVYPLQAEGELRNLPLKVADPANPAISVEVTQPGKVEILLNFGGGDNDRRLFADVVVGVNLIPWDGKTGVGTAIQETDYPIPVNISYTQGETHFTAYDTEGLDNGFQVYTVTRGGSVGPRLQFWDDSNIPDEPGTSDAQVNVDAGASSRRRWTNYLYGDVNTINTWWFAYRTAQTTTVSLPGISGSVRTPDGDAIQGVTVELQDDQGNIVNDTEGNPLSSVTDASGTYRFIKVPNGDYVIVETDLAAYLSVSDADNNDDGDTANTNTNDNKIPVTVISNEQDSGNDFIDVAITTNAITQCSAGNLPDHLIEYHFGEPVEGLGFVNVGDVRNFTNVAVVNGRQINAKLTIEAIDSTAPVGAQVQLKYQVAPVDSLVVRVESGPAHSQDNSVKYHIDFVHQDDGTPAFYNFAYHGADIDGGVGTRQEYLRFYTNEIAETMVSNPTNLIETSTNSYREYRGTVLQSGEPESAAVSIFNGLARITMKVGQRDTEGGADFLLDFEKSKFTLPFCHGFDFGDAQGYSTTGVNAAKHAVIDHLYLGTSVDIDAGIQENSTANADDLSGIIDAATRDDESGVASLSEVDLVNPTYTLDITATNNTGTGAANLVGWIDFDGNGTFDADEASALQIVADGSTATTVTLTWTIPADAIKGESFIRLRYTQDALANTDATGTKNSGEVEDYAVSIKRSLLPFVCDGTPYTVINNPSMIQQMDKQTLAVSALGNLKPAIDINGIGYNALDNMVYGYYTGDGTAGNTGIGTGNIIRYGSGLYFEDLGKPIGGGVFDPATQTGAMDNAGLYYGISSSTLFIVDIGSTPEPGTLTFTSVARSGDLSVTEDIAFSTYDDALYGVSGSKLIRITKAGVGSVVATSGDALPAASGGAWSSADGNLYFYNNVGGQLYHIDMSNPTPVVTNVGNVANNGSFDATACTPPVLLKDASVSETVSGGNFDYTYTMFNAFNSPVMVNFSDVLPATLKYKAGSLSDNSPGGGSVSSFTDSALTISGIQLPAQGKVSFTVTVLVDPAISVEQDIDNQAFIDYGAVRIKSDDPDTGTIEDPTRVHILPLDLGDAPDSYGDAGHGVPALTTVYLGVTKPDVDIASQNAANGGEDGLGDDNDGSDDEGAIASFDEIDDLATSYSISAVVNNRSGTDANLVGWIDFDSSGVFDADEAVSIAIANGSNGAVILEWNNIPTDITSGDTYVRLRLTTDSSIATGDALTSLSTGLAMDGEVEDYPLFIKVGGFPVKGRVYNDSNVDGVSDASEEGVGSLPVVLVDVTNNTCVSTKTAADGSYTFFPVIPGNYQIYEASRETVPVPQNCNITKAKDPAGYRSTTDNVLPQFSVVDAEITGKDFGDVKSPLFSPNHSGTILEGNTILYTHKFTPKSTGTVTFSNNNSGDVTSGWTSTVYQDLDCNGKLDGADGNTPATDNMTTTAGQAICLINKVFAPAGVVEGETFVNVINAGFNFNNNALAGDSQTQVTDSSKASVNDPIVGHSKLELRKTVENITQGTGETDTQNQAKPGDVLKYRLYYRNSGTGLISDLKINDTLPAYTTLQSIDDCNVALPDRLTGCTATQNGDAIEWTFDVGNELDAGSAGVVSYSVKVD